MQKYLIPTGECVSLLSHGSIETTRNWNGVWLVRVAGMDLSKYHAGILHRQIRMSRERRSGKNRGYTASRDIRSISSPVTIL